MRRILPLLLCLLASPACAQIISGGALTPAAPYAFVAAATNNEQQVKWGNNAATMLYGIQCESIASASAMWLKAYNGAPTIGSTPAVDQWSIPAAPSTGGTGIVWVFPNGVQYPNGLYVTLTGGQSLTDNTSVSAGAANCTVYYR